MNSDDKGSDGPSASSPPRVRWTRLQQLLVLRLYLRLRFGQLHKGNAEIIALARRIGRTPDAIAMKATNFASLDPQITETGRKGHRGASQSDRALWAEFLNDSEAIAAEAEQVHEYESVPGDVPRAELQLPTGPTEAFQIVRARRVQSFFRSAVLTSYDSRCAISGIAEPAILRASHIIPWSADPKRRADPTNGICLNALFDCAFDRGLITIDSDLRVVVSRRLRELAESSRLHCSIAEAHGVELMLPYRMPPADNALEYHRRNQFQE